MQASGGKLVNINTGQLPVVVDIQYLVYRIDSQVTYNWGHLASM